jgi:iron complex outermembrane receptor protein
MHFSIVRQAAPLVAAASAIFLPSTQAAEPAARTMDTVIVKADRLPDDVEAERAVTPGAVTTLDGDTLYERNVTQLSEMLRYVPGVYSESYNGNDDVFYSSRGSNLDATDYDKNGVKFLQDGLPVSAADGNNHNRALDPLGARNATFAHGANALAYGASTLGGAMDFVSPTALDTRSNFSMSGGSFGDWGGRATLGGVSGDFDGLVTAETRQRDGYRDHSAQDRKAVYSNIGWAASENVSTRFFANYVDYYAELPRELSLAQYHADPDSARADAILGNHSKDVQSLRIAVKTTIAGIAGGTLEAGASYEHQDLFHPIVSTPFFSLLIDTAHEDTGAMVRYQRDAGSHDLLFGANYGYSTVNGGNYTNERGQRGFLMWTTDDEASSLEVFALDRWSFAPDWRLVYGAQFISSDRNVSGFKADYNAVNPRLGFIRNLGGQSEWYASASRVYEAPTTFELTDDVNGGSTPLAAMHGTVVETGLRGANARGETHLNWDVSIYFTALRDEILSRDDPGAPGTSLSANIAETTHAGIEALVGASFAPGSGRHRIEPLLSATYNAFTFDSDPEYGDNRLPSAPRYFVRGELMYRNTSGFSAGPTFDFIGAKYVDFANTWRLGSYGLLGARAGYKTETWDVFAEARNLLDRDYVATVLVKDVVTPTSEMLFPGSPRSFYAGLRYQF